MDIASFIPKGSVNAVTRRELVTMTGLSDRKVRGAIEQSRLSGAPIVFRNGISGYFIAENPEEVISNALELEARAKSLFITAKALRRTAEKMDSKQTKLSNL